MFTKDKKWEALVPTIKVKLAASWPEKCTVSTKALLLSASKNLTYRWHYLVQQQVIHSVTAWFSVKTVQSLLAMKLEIISLEAFKLSLSISMAKEVNGLSQTKMFSTNSKPDIQHVKKLMISFNGEEIQIQEDGKELLTMMAQPLEHVSHNKQMTILSIVKLLTAVSLRLKMEVESWYLLENSLPSLLRVSSQQTTLQLQGIWLSWSLIDTVTLLEEVLWRVVLLTTLWASSHKCRTEEFNGWLVTLTSKMSMLSEWKLPD